MDNVPVPVATGALARLQEAVNAGMAPALAIMLDDTLFAQVQKIATVMSKAQGFVPTHCVGNTEVCFAITTRSLVWRLDPFAVAQSTYQPVEGGKVAYEAKLVQAILEQSGRLDGPITREYRGDWSKVQGKFRMQTSEKSGKKYAVGAYTEADEAGLGITVSAKLKGEAERRTVALDLRQCHPRNSTLWATDPMTQIYYRAVRMLGNVAMPGVLMGVPFVGEEDDEDSRFARARDVTGRAEVRASAPPEMVEIVDAYGEMFLTTKGEAEERAREWVVGATDEELAALAENNPAGSYISLLVTQEKTHRPTADVEPGLPLDDPDPLKIGSLSLKDAIATLEMTLDNASPAEADRLLATYRERIEPKAPKAWAALADLVAAKIEERG